MGQDLVAHLSGQVDIEQTWKKDRDRLRCDLTIRTGTVRLFTPGAPRTSPVGRMTLTFWTNSFGQILDVRGAGVRSLDELIANFDLLAAGLIALVVPFPEKGVRPGDAWQVSHQLGPELNITLAQCTERVGTPSGPLLKIRLRSLIPMDLLVEPALRQLMDLRVRYHTEGDVLFDVSSGRVQSASGTIRVQMGFKVPLSGHPAQPSETPSPSPPREGNTEEGGETQGKGEGTPPEEGSSPDRREPSYPPPLTAPTFTLSLDARFELIQRP